MDAIFSAEFFSGNRRRLRLAVAAANKGRSDIPVVVTANGLLQRGGDNTFPFQQDSSFWYLTGISESDITLVMNSDSEYLIVPGRSVSRQAFDGVVGRTEIAVTSGVTEVLDESDGWKRLASSIKQSSRLATPEAALSYIEDHGMYTNPARARLAARLRETLAGLVFVDIRQELALLRMIKQPIELMALQRAIDITIDSLQLLTEPTRFAGYHNEYEIEADLTREFRYRGAAGHAFAPIIAGGKRACTLHNVSNQAMLEKDSLVILDVGAEVSHYAADITRTRVYGKPSPRQRQVLDAVLDVQSYALTLLRPGSLFKSYEQAVETYMGKTLRKLKLVKTTDQANIRKYFPHSTSHFLGLDVHDVGDYARPLEPGVVLTCEPGIYIPEEGIGVRIEDDIVITTTGNEVLSRRLPSSII